MFSRKVAKSLLVVVLLLAGAVSPVVAAAQVAPPSPPANGSGGNATGGGVGTGATPGPGQGAGVPTANNSSGGGGGGLLGALGGFGKWFDGVANAIANPLESFQNLTGQILRLSVDRPVPLRNGSPAYFEKPTDPLMAAVWEVVWSMVLPVAILLVALHAAVAMGLHGIIPPAVVPNQKTKGEVWSAIGKLFHVILSWTLIVAWMVLCQFVAQWAMPTGQQVFPGGRSIIEQVVAGGVGGVVLWLSSGVLLVLGIIVWILGWLGATVAPALYPLAVAADPPDLPVVRHFTMLPSEGVLLTLIAVPVPTAAILGLGYPIINGIRDATSGPIAAIFGIRLVILLTLGMWFAAFVAPIVMVAKSRQMRPAAMFVAGALGAAGAMSVRDKMGNLPNIDLGGGTGGMAGTGGGGTTVDPLEGSPFQRSTDGGQYGGGLAAGDGGDSGASALGAGGAAGGGASGGGVGASPAPSTDGGGGGTPGVSSTSTSTSSAGTAADAGAGHATTEHAVSSPNELPRDQQYEIGYYRDGDWQPIEDTTFDREFVLGEGYSRVENAYDGRDLMARGAQDAETYDVRDVAQMDN